MFKAARNIFAFSAQSFNPSKNYYKILSVQESASAEAIKTSYKTLAKKYHPDVNKGQQELFKEVNEAYQVLSDPPTKKQYDLSRSFNSSNHSSPYSQYNNYSSTQDPRRTHYQHHPQYQYNPYRRHPNPKMHSSWSTNDQQLYEFYRRQQADYMNRYYETQRQKFDRGYRSPIEEEYMRRFMEEVARSQQNAEELKRERQSQARMQEQRLQREYEQSKRKLKEMGKQVFQQVGNLAKGLWKAYSQLKKKK